MAQIVDNGGKRMIWLDAENRVYMQRAFTEQQPASVSTNTSAQYNPCDEFPGVEYNHLKSTELNGRRVDKWPITMNTNGSERHVFQWFDQPHRYN